MVVRGRLWRLSNPHIPEDIRIGLVSALMDARRAVKEAKSNVEAMKLARQRVDAIKTSLGERGAVWWADDAPDYNRKLARNTPYRDWFETLGNGA